MDDNSLTVERLLASGLYERKKGGVFSKYYPGKNFLSFPETSADVPEENDGQSESTVPPEEESFGLTFKWRSISMKIGDPSDLALARRATYRRTRKDYDSGYAFHGLKQHILIPELKTYIVDDHHLLYYVLCEASVLGLIDTTDNYLLNFDAHHDIASVRVPPPAPVSDLSLQARYAVTHLRLGTHLTAILQAGLAGKVIWFANPEELDLKATDMDPDLVANKQRFDIRFLHQIEDGFLENIPPEKLVISIDWDYLSALYNQGFVLEEVTLEMVDDFVSQLRRIGVKKDSYGLIFICTSPSYTEERSLIPGIRHFLSRLSVHLKS